jgi:hypothetical protein
VRPLRAQVEGECFERFGHVAVSHVPRERLAEEQRAIIPLGVSHEARVLFRNEERVARDASVAQCIDVGGPSQLDELVDHRGFARWRQAEVGGIPVGLGVRPEGIEARIARSRALCRRRVHGVEVGEDRGHRCVQTIQVESVEAGALCPVRQTVVVAAQPADEIEHVGVAPHPLWEPREAGEGIGGVGIVAHSAHEPVDTIRVGPVRFHRHPGESPSLIRRFVISARTR